MNNFNTQHLLEIAKQRTQQELRVIHLSQKKHKPSLTNRTLAALGSWMVAGGEKLQALNSESFQKNQLGFSQNR